MKFKGTKGPWETGNGGKLIFGDNSFLAEVNSNRNITELEAEANAKLIAAAPELLKALIGEVKFLKGRIEVGVVGGEEVNKSFAKMMQARIEKLEQEIKKAIG